MYAPGIVEVKTHLDELKKSGLIEEWELPYENLLTRRSAAIFFLNPSGKNDQYLEKVWDELNKYEDFSQRLNEEKKLSKMLYRITFSKEEKDRNSKN